MPSEIYGIPEFCPGSPFIECEEDVNPADPPECYYQCGLAVQAGVGRERTMPREDWTARERAMSPPR